MKFDWDAANTRHLARHDIIPEEAEQAVLIDPLIADVQQQEAEERTLCFGRTESGRLLTVLYEERRGKIRIITGYAMTRQQQEIYFEGK